MSSVTGNFNFIHKGQIQVIFGPMFSGKTTELIRRMKRYQVANYTCLLIKYANDTRYAADDIATHDRQTMRAISATSLDKCRKVADEHDVIGIDEGQFFPDIVNFCEDLANAGKTVVVAALDGTFQRQGFGDILRLVPLAENVLKLSAVCMKCFGEASYTKRIGTDTKVEIIGGTDMYMAVCRRCYYSPKKGLILSDSPSPSKIAKTLFPTPPYDNEMELSPDISSSRESL